MKIRLHTLILDGIDLEALLNPPEDDDDEDDEWEEVDEDLVEF